MAKEVKYTPMMTQYLEVKKNYQDSIMFYRLGDFYEMFFEDAKIASQELDLVLTARNAGVEEKVPMCGIPHHAATGYIQRLIQKGYKVAIVEQMEDPSTAKGIVKRDVIKIVTPGTIMEEVGDEKSTVYIAGMIDFQYGLACVLCEMTTGECRAQIIDKNVMSIQKVLLGNNVREVVLPEKFDRKIIKMLEELQTITISHMDNENRNHSYDYLVQHVDDERIQHAFTILTNYLDETQKRSMSHLKHVEVIHEDEFLQMDFSTKANLELTQGLKNNGKTQTLWTFLDKCQSAMGSRLLKRWIEYPLVNKDEILKRQHAITYLNKNFLVKDELKETLTGVYDLERLSARIAYGNANPRDLLRLVKTLKVTPFILNTLKDCEGYEHYKDIDVCEELCELLDGAFVDNPPISIKDGGIFVDGYYPELDECRKIGKSGKDFIIQLENKERERTGIKSLKIGYNRIFGYYIEVTKTNLDLVKEEYGYIRKQTLTNAERFVTEELKEKEDAILHAQERSIKLETELFNQLVSHVKTFLPKIHMIADALATIDVLYALSVISNQSGYVKPEFHEGSEVELVEARHPILEKVMKDKRYISNSLHMEENQCIMIITGPNMGGKSTFMRQTALLVIMAQIGCFVPAKKALMPIFDKIFTRIGASDDIMSGQSTFMVEMMEANNALQNASDHSLILFDEIGRGTSTYDGMALAHAMIEYINENIKAKTLFSTHYHELTDLGEMYDSIRNIHVEVHEENDTVTFLYRMKEGKADKSYGINVARLAKLPTGVLERAKQLLKGYETENTSNVNLQTHIEWMEKDDPVMNEIKNQIHQIDVNQMTPMDALQFVYDLKKKIN